MSATFIAPFVAPSPHHEIIRHSQRLHPLPHGRRTYARRRTVVRSTLLVDVLLKAAEVTAATMVTSTLTSPPSTPSYTTAASAASELRTLLSDAARLSTRLAGQLPARDSPTARSATKLAVCLLVDLIGSGSLGFPLLSDMLDVIVAPVSAVVLHALFAHPLVTAVGFAEEILPGTDGLPTATLAWLACHYGYLRVSDASAPADNEPQSRR